jgi:hypothetical protein
MRMANEELQAMKEDITEIKQTVKETNKALNDLNVLVAGNYVKREELDEFQKTNTEEHKELNQKITDLNKRITDLIYSFAIAVIGTIIYFLVRGGK